MERIEPEEQPTRSAELGSHPKLPGGGAHTESACGFIGGGDEKRS